MKYVFCFEDEVFLMGYFFPKLKSETEPRRHFRCPAGNCFRLRKFVKRAVDLDAVFLKGREAPPGFVRGFWGKIALGCRDQYPACASEKLPCIIIACLLF